MPIRILVVDDSAFMRKAISMMLEEDHGIEVVGTARDGLEAIEKVRELNPDLMTLDVEMPRMDGITALKQIMKDNPLPVLMVSSLTLEGARATIDALAAGAVDFIPKQLSYISMDITKIKGDLISKIKAVARRGTRIISPPLSNTASVPKKSSLIDGSNAQIVVLGISTGGPFSLQRVIPSLREDFPLPIAIVQHMPPLFTKSLAERLDSISRLEVCEAEDGMELVNGKVFIAPGGFHLKFSREDSKVFLVVSKLPNDTLHRPSVDVMFSSAYDTFGGRVLAIVMTGMGKDGLEGAKMIKSAGGKILAQSEDTCVVYGMPKAIVDARIADSVVPLEEIASVITSSVSTAGTTV
ncbi:MAG TPA: chemotaxis response regulator protein-glutamate methylesterase [Candidatus Acidoferrales bacterium]|nr:chemotaxis response regulator protein-glutamate methylesterase [Candidatus Acidoferrales bacterium]